MMDFNFKHFNPRNLLLKLSTIGKYFLHGGIKIPLRVIWMIMVICCILYFFFVASPVRFPVGSIVEIKEGLTTKEIAQSLEDKKVIKSKLLFETIEISHSLVKGHINQSILEGSLICTDKNRKNNILALEKSFNGGNEKNINYKPNKMTQTCYL